MIEFQPASKYIHVHEGVQQQLYVRLFLRKHQWLRVAKLKYDHIAEDLTPITAGLVANAFLSNGILNYK